MHILTKLKINVGPVLEDAEEDHFNHSGVRIEKFILPAFMYAKLSTEPGFYQDPEVKTLGFWKGFKIVRRDSVPYPMMSEFECNARYQVFYEREERTQP